MPLSRPEPYGRADKRQAITQAARRVFGRDGYTRAGMDSIAAAAGYPSGRSTTTTPTRNKLFLTVALEGAEDVTAAIAQIMDRHLPGSKAPVASRRRTVRPGAAAGGQVSRARSRPWPVCSAACSSGR
ncbi:TetR/AcrR family transcriptional regulator [Nonomuraea sp. NPDC004702]